MNRTLMTLILVILFMNACATIHGGGNYAVPVKGNVTSDTFATEVKNVDKTSTEKGLLVSGSENTSLSSQYFTLIDLTFENIGAEWLRVTKVAIDFGSDKANSEIRFPIGQDLMDWAQSAQQVQAIRNYNMQMGP